MFDALLRLLVSRKRPSKSRCNHPPQPHSECRSQGATASSTHIIPGCEEERADTHSCKQIQDYIRLSAARWALSGVNNP